MSLLYEKIKNKIIEGLTKGELSFSEILKYVGLRDHGQLNYHLKLLVNEGLVVKEDKKYILSLNGENLGIYLKQFLSEESYPASVVCGVVQDDKGRILMLRRAKSPERMKWGFPGGKLAMGEKISEAAEREVLEESGLDAKFDKVLGFFPSLIYKDKELHFHVNLILVLMKCVDDCNVTLTDEHDDFKFIDLKDLDEYDLVVNNREILEKGFLDNNEFVFSEIVHER